MCWLRMGIGWITLSKSSRQKKFELKKNFVFTSEIQLMNMNKK